MAGYVPETVTVFVVVAFAPHLGPEVLVDVMSNRISVKIRICLSCFVQGMEFAPVIGGLNY